MCVVSPGVTVIIIVGSFVLGFGLLLGLWLVDLGRLEGFVFLFEFVIFSLFGFALFLFFFTISPTIFLRIGAGSLLPEMSSDFSSIVFVFGFPSKFLPMANTSVNFSSSSISSSSFHQQFS